MGLRTRFLRWLQSDNKPVLVGRSDVAITAEAADENAELRFSIGKAINGRVITISKFKRNPHGPDWTHQLYVVPEGTDLMDSIKTCIIINALSK